MAGSMETATIREGETTASMNIELNLNDEELSWNIPGTPRWPDGVTAKQKWIPRGNYKFMAVAYSDDDLDLDDPDKKMKYIYVYKEG